MCLKANEDTLTILSNVFHEDVRKSKYPLKLFICVDKQTNKQSTTKLFLK